MLHIHNGASTAGTLKEFGFPGHHFAFDEVLMAGPTPGGLSADDWRRLRAGYLSDAYDLNLSDCERDLERQEETLASFHEHDEVILWFEHDLFCQVNLIYLLNWFSVQARDSTRLSLICIGEFPGVRDFRGLGQLTGAQLASLFDGRSEVTPPQFRLAANAWAAYCATDPEAIERLLAEDTSAMPFLRRALTLHLARFPSVTNGLGRIENKALELLSSGPVKFKSLFPKFAASESAYGLGDLQFWNELKPLAEGKRPLVTILGLADDRLALEDNWYHEAVFELTQTGREVLAGDRDFIDANCIDRWLGGIHVVDGKRRWDAQAEKLVRSAR